MGSDQASQEFEIAKGMLQDLIPSSGEQGKWEELDYLLLGFFYAYNLDINLDRVLHDLDRKKHRVVVTSLSSSSRSLDRERTLSELRDSHTLNEKKQDSQRCERAKRLLEEQARSDRRSAITSSPEALKKTLTMVGIVVMFIRDLKTETLDRFINSQSGADRMEIVDRDFLAHMGKKGWFGKLKSLAKS